MITAREAKELYDPEVDQFLNNEVEKKVSDAAKSGKRQVFIYLGSVNQFEYLHNAITPLQQAVLVKLKEFGYIAEIRVDGAPYVPRGLADDNGDGPIYTNYGIQIGW